MKRLRARERLRQEREAFDLARKQHSRWFSLRLAMGYVCTILLIGIAMVATAILLNRSRYSPGVLAIAATALLTEMAATAFGTFKLVLQRDNAGALRPITGDNRPDRDHQTPQRTI